MTNPIRTFGLILLCLFAAQATAETIRDYYDEPGLNPFKDAINQHFNESIDPFSGMLQLSYTDILVPGNGGLDIRVNRFYSPKSDASLGVRTPYGVGWTMHFGRIVVNERFADRICQQGIYAARITDNPSLERGDGSREVLVLASGEPDAYLITRSRWKADCEPDGVVRVTSPSGTQFKMSYQVFAGDSVSLYTTQILDTSGNTIDIDYRRNAVGISYINTVTAGDGRRVDYHYKDLATDHPVLDRISVSRGGVDSQTWRYVYTEIPNVAGHYNHLTEVVRPDARRWRYAYNPYFAEYPAKPGSHSIRQVTYPNGATLDYRYRNVAFHASSKVYSVIGEKTLSKWGAAGAGAPVTWTYDYNPAYRNGTEKDITTVTSPFAREVYYHVGKTSAALGQAWTIGLLMVKEVYEPGPRGQRLYQETNTWGYQVISSEDYWHGGDNDFVDRVTVAPLITRRQTWTGRGNAGSTLRTDYSNYDRYGHPGRIVETSNILGERRRETLITYKNDTQRWILGLPERETLSGIGDTTRRFDEAGRLRELNQYGVITRYTYTGEGDLQTQTDARGYTTRFSDYYRGIARREEHPVSQTETLIIKREVNSSGTVASITDARGYTTAFTYDDLNRLTGIDYPINDDVGIEYGYAVDPIAGYQRRLTRGRYAETIVEDGFGRAVLTARGDTHTGEILTTHSKYDAAGRLIFTSYPNAEIGVATTYDALDRVLATTYPDGHGVSIQYHSATRVGVTNERGNRSDHLYRAYGGPGDKQLVQVDSPENIRTTLYRNALGQLTDVWQGNQQGRNGYFQRYQYNAKRQLIGMDKRETGHTAYGRDEVGNMISRQVAANGITHYSYDGLGRLTHTDHPGDTPDLSFVYDENGNLLSAESAVSQMSYVYDENDNLTQEHILINSAAYTLGYTYNGLDMLEDITYPSGRVIGYAPDALGRATRVGEYVTQLSYHPSGPLERMVMINGQVSEYDLDPERLWMSAARAGLAGSSVRAMDLSYAHDPAGNILAVTDAEDPQYDLALGYDAMDRLTRADGVWGQGRYSYDVLGNIQSRDLGDSHYTYHYFDNRLLRVAVTEAGKSRNRDYLYDDYANATHDGRYYYAYDDAGNLRRASLSSVHIPVTDEARLYDYDSNNLRVRRRYYKDFDDVDEQHYVYTAAGRLLGEYEPGVQKSKEYIYLGDKMIATAEGAPDSLADAGPDLIVEEGEVVTLTGRLIKQGATILGYRWAQIAGIPVRRTFPAADSVRFTAPEGLYNVELEFSLTITYGYNEKATDTVKVTVRLLDTDGDGLSDNWERRYFGDLSQDADGDFDGDFESNLIEFQNGSDPTRKPDLGDILDLQAVPGNAEATLSWNATARAERYDLYWSTEPGVTPATGTHIADVTSPYVHAGLTNGQPYYYVLVASAACCNPGSWETRAVPGLTGWGAPARLSNSGDYHARLGGYHNARSMLIRTGRDTEYKTIEVMRLNATQGWSAPEVLDRERRTLGDLDEPVIATAADGSAVALWWRIKPAPVKQGEYVHTLRARHYDPASGWGATLNITETEGAIGDIAPELHLGLDANGGAKVIYQWGYYDNGFGATGDFFEVATYLSYSPIGGWSGDTPLLTPPTGTRFADLNAAFSPNGHALLTYAYETSDYAADTTDYTINALRYRPGQGWGNETPLGAQQQPYYTRFYPETTGVIDDQGRVTALWTRSYIVDQGQHDNRILSRRYDPIGGWGVVEHVGERVSQDLKLIAESDGDLLALWGVYYGETQSTRYNRYDAVQGAWARPRYMPPLQTPDNGLICNTPVIDGSDTHSVIYNGADDLRIYVRSSSDSHEHGLRGESLRAPYNLSAPLRVGESNSHFVSDGQGNILAAWAYGGAYNRYFHIAGSPLAHAGPNQTVVEGSAVGLDASRSNDAQGITSYRWTQLSGTPVSLSGANTATPSFTAPAAAGYCGTRDTYLEGPVAYPYEPLVFELRVSDGDGLLAADTVKVTVLPNRAPPVADAGVDQGVRAGATVTLNAGASIDSDGVIAHYYWRQTEGPAIEALDYTDAGIIGKTAAFTAPAVSTATDLVFELRVVDDTDLDAFDTVRITVNP